MSQCPCPSSRNVLVEAGGPTVLTIGVVFHGKWFALQVLHHLSRQALEEVAVLCILCQVQRGSIVLRVEPAAVTALTALKAFKVQGQQ